MAKNLLTILLCVLCAQLWAQRDTQHATLFGIGRVDHLDTYLSPQSYTGAQVSVMHQTMRDLKRNPNISFHTTLTGNMSMTENKAETGTEDGGDVSYTAGWYRHWDDVLFRGLRLLAGGQIGGDIGGLYNTRNGNNPAQVYVSASMAASLGARYAFHIRRRMLTLHYSVSLPLVGAMFSPAYDQSYYELFSLGHTDHNLCFKHPFNGLDLVQQFSFDLPIRRSRLRFAYLSQMRQSDVNNIRQHHISRSFMVGYVRELTIKR